MKKIIFTHLFLNLYLLVLIQPAIPVIEYFVNYDYIVEELCENRDKPLLACNGKCYLEKQVTKQQNLDHKEEAPVPPKVDLEKFLTLNTKKFIYQVFEEIYIKKTPSYYLSLEENTFIDSLLRPPIS
ncbi:MAG: hypothetical protein ABFR05_08965 [Bacteroidota bacterium]